MRSCAMRKPCLASEKEVTRHQPAGGPRDIGGLDGPGRLARRPADGMLMARWGVVRLCAISQCAPWQRETDPHPLWPLGRPTGPASARPATRHAQPTRSPTVQWAWLTRCLDLLAQARRVAFDNLPLPSQIVVLDPIHPFLAPEDPPGAAYHPFEPLASSGGSIESPLAAPPRVHLLLTAPLQTGTATPYPIIPCRRPPQPHNLAHSLAPL